jgi:flagellar motor switch protein FliM
MTASSGVHLNRVRLHRLLAAVGSTPVPAEVTAEAALYDWRDPHYFDEDQRNRLAAIMSQVAAVLSERCVHFFNSEFEVVPASITQHFAADAARHAKVEQSFALTFGPAQKPPCGFLAIGAAVALDWVTRLLGDSESDQDPNRPLSSLEESLLSDLAGAITEAFLDSLRPHQDLKAASQVSREAAPVSFEPTDPICRIVFRIRRAEAETASEVTFMVGGPTLAPVLGKSIPAKPNVKQDELSRLLMEHVHRMPVTMCARLASMRLSFEEVLDLAPGDVLLLDKGLDEPVDLILRNETVFRGRPAQKDGQYAVLITERAADSHPDAPRGRNAKQA